MRLRSTLALAAAMTALALPASAPAAAPPLLFQIPPESIAPGEGAGELNNPRGVATNRDNGHVFVAETFNARVSEFTSWGEFVKAWGWGVADGSAELQTCGPPEPEPSPSPGLCRAGIAGAGKGQLTGPTGVAVDGGGNVYVLENQNHRVSKFGPDGSFLLMFGGEVNKTKTEEPGSTEAERNLCTAASGDVCQGGSAGAGKGQFANGQFSDFIAVGPGEELYVGDKDRIQRLNTSGEYQGEINFEGDLAAFAGTAVSGLDVGPAGDIDVTLVGSDDVYELSPAGALVRTFPLVHPKTVAVSSEKSVYVSRGSFATSSTGESIVAFAPGGEITIPLSEKFAASGLPGASGDLSAVSAGGRCPGEIAANVCVPTGLTCTTGGGEPIYAAHTNLIDPPERSYVDVYGPPPCFEDPPSVPPDVKDQYAVSVEAGEAVVRAEINPRFWNDTTYYVEYGTGECSAGGCKSQPAAPGSRLTTKVLNGPVRSAGVLLSDLEPDTTYHYRFVAQSGGGGPVRGEGGEVGLDGAEGTFTTPPPRPRPKADCPNQGFRVGAGAYLPDCRAYEMVSPLDKDGGDILAFTTQAGPSALVQSATSGDRFTYASYRAFGDAQSAPYSSQYLASRTAAGWSTEAISPPRQSGSFYGDGNTTRAQDSDFKAFSPDLCSAWLRHDSEPPLAAGVPGGFTNLYRREGCDDPLAYEALIPSSPLTSPAPSPFDPQLQGIGGDCVVFRANDALAVTGVPASGKANGVSQVYESCGGVLRLVSVLPGGAASDLESSAGTVNDLIFHEKTSTLEHAVSADGSRVYWTASPALRGPGVIYLRENAAQEQSKFSAGKCSQPTRACTFPVSGTVSNQAAQFWTATPDGSQALFSVGKDLYRFDAESKASTLIAHGFRGAAGASDDLSRIYLVSEEALSGEGENSEGEEAIAGEPNLYLHEGGEFAFVGGLSELDVSGGTAFPSPVSTLPILHTARTTPDGATLAFGSTAPLTSYDNADVDSGEPVAEVFVYDAASAELACASCNPTGARPAGRDISETGVSPFRAAARIPPSQSTSLYATRALSADGRRLFFESFESLVPRDTNGRQDVYEWQHAADKKACEEQIGGDLFLPSSKGCLALISSGQSASDSSFLDASPSGEDVFFTTEESLLSHDTGLIDVYDARVGGGFPPPPPPPPACLGDACQSVPAPPNDPTPASAGFRGAGNLAARCARSKRRVTRGGKTRCVAKKQRRGRRRAAHGKGAARRSSDAGGTAGR
jgi:hypothetical protein